jgi:hypothetical protein
VEHIHGSKYKQIIEFLEKRKQQAQQAKP